jgi:uroporphyrinogen decarboxylase
MVRSMTKRDIVRMVFEGRQAPYVPWHFIFSTDATALLRAHYGVADLERAVDNHMLMLRRSSGSFRDVGGGRVQDVFGVVWDRTLDKDIGIVTGLVLPEPTLRDFSLPDPLDPRFYLNWDGLVADDDDRFRVFSASYSLFERAWSLRGLENTMMDFYDNPEFVHELLDVLADFNIAQVKEALKYDIDAVYFGDDWGQQHGLLMSRRTWNEFIRPRVARMYQAVHDAGKFVMNHSCGDVDELFDDLITLGLNCSNPFQPEVMDVDDLMDRYRGRLAFLGGLSTQQTLPKGSPADVRRESEHLLAKGRAGSSVFAPAHGVQGDVPLENILAFIDAAQLQEGYPAG